MTQPDPDKARSRLSAYLGYEPDEHDALFESHLDVYRASVFREAADQLPAYLGTAGDDVEGEAHDRALLWVADLLRRMAEEDAR